MRVTSYLFGGPFDGHIVSTSDEEMRIVPLWEGDDLKGMVVAAKYVMKPLEGDQRRGYGRTTFPPQATHQFRGWITTDVVLVTDAITPNEGAEWSQEIP